MCCSKRAIIAGRIFVFSFLILLVFYPVPANPDDESGGRSSPIVLANVLYNGYSESSGDFGRENHWRGHVTATRIYDPLDPKQTKKAELWDAGEVLNNMEPGDRNIFVPDHAVTRIKDLTIATGNGIARTFSGTLNCPIVATTVRITDSHETFKDEQAKTLVGDFGGAGTINRFNGTFDVTFDAPPGSGVPVKCSYAYYEASSDLVSFNKSNIDNDNLSLDETPNIPDGYLYDLDGDGHFSESDGDWLVEWVRGYEDGASTKRKWLLGSVDHSVPAVAGPPGRPNWYYGSQISEDERAEYDCFVRENEERHTVLYVGAGDGMLHAFDAGQFRWGDNPETAPVEQRGYFRWVALEGDKSPDYGSGEELWAFIPPGILPRLKNNLLSAEDRASMDASPAIADVSIAGAWRTVLVASEGNEGDAIFCLDITNPDRPLFLWEFADPDLIRGRSSPPAAQIGRIAFAGIKRWVAFFASGDASDAGLEPSIYVIDIADGDLVARIFLHAGMDRDGNGIDDGRGGACGGAPAIVDSDGNGYVDRMYIGTDKGFMFRVNIPDDPEIAGFTFDQCVINTDFSYEVCFGSMHSLPADQQFHPICASPAVVVDNDYNQGGDIEYNIRLFFGTSNRACCDEMVDGEDAPCHFFAYTDKNGKGECNAAAVNLMWFYETLPGHQILVSASVGAGTVYFGASRSETEDQGAEPATGMLYALDMMDGTVILEKVLDSSIISSPLVEDEHLYIKTRISGEKTPMVLGGGGYNNDVVKIPTAPVGIRSWKEIW